MDDAHSLMIPHALQFESRSGDERMAGMRDHRYIHMLMASDDLVPWLDIIYAALWLFHALFEKIEDGWYA